MFFPTNIRRISIFKKSWKYINMYVRFVELYLTILCGLYLEHQNQKFAIIAV